MLMTMVHQATTPSYIRMQLERFGTTQLVVADLADVDNSSFSLALNGFRGFSQDAQDNILLVFHFFRDLMELYKGIPLDLTDIKKLRPLYKQWLAGREETAVVRTASEQAASNGQKK
jgi:hypothetical protein